VEKTSPKERVPAHGHHFEYPEYKRKEMISFSSSPPEREKRKIICKCKPKSKIFLC
jgi:hypothetical protein